MGVDQTGNSFWIRIKENYNNNRNQFLERNSGQLKSRWFRINKAVSGNLEKDIMENAYKIYSQDVGDKFNFEHALLLLRDEPKWKSESMESSFKRSKITKFGQYSTSCNIDAVSDCQEYDLTTPICRPIGQKVAKRKSKVKVDETSFDKKELDNMTKAILERSVVVKKLAEAKELANFSAMYEILIKDTFGMTKKQLKDHELACNFIRRKLGE
uniref:No apical meristem-associated C-terminal domain-containing protein n=1 Tax=Cajanus cajan TaxID=3821 RepID=A0A151RAF6_CAJCA|nr:hypothetical protein KK1_039083 [Cajanus cajan]